MFFKRNVSRDIRPLFSSLKKHHFEFAKDIRQIVWSTNISDNADPWSAVDVAYTAQPENITIELWGSR
jgi:hypothetical protein